ncbi:MAG: glutamate racemase [Selenomonadaceae bacterium]|nr:glutamate racemase [Selenomonadaceae bacterium]
MRIAFFDSGIGGLSVMHHALRLLPADEFIFFADEDHVPYGTRSPDEVLRLVDDAFRFLIALDVNAVAVACNTATSAAVREMRRRYDIPIVGMEPAIKLAFDLYGSRRVLVTATPITINGEKIKRLIDRLGRQDYVELLALPMLVDFAERQEFESAAVEEYLRRALEPYDFGEFSSIVLGCTHFNYFKDTLRSLLPSNVRFVDGNEGTLRELARRMNIAPSAPRGSIDVRYYYSGRRIDDDVELERIGKYLRRLDRMIEIN